MPEAFKFASQTQANTTIFIQNMKETPHKRTCRNVPQQRKTNTQKEIQTNIIWDSKQKFKKHITIVQTAVLIRAYPFEPP